MHSIEPNDNNIQDEGEELSLPENQIHERWRTINSLQWPVMQMVRISMTNYRISPVKITGKTSFWQIMWTPPGSRNFIYKNYVKNYMKDWIKIFSGFKWLFKWVKNLAVCWNEGQMHGRLNSMKYSANLWVYISNRIKHSPPTSDKTENMEIKMLLKQPPSGRMLINFYRLHFLDIPKSKWHSHLFSLAKSCTSLIIQVLKTVYNTYYHLHNSTTLTFQHRTCWSSISILEKKNN